MSKIDELISELCPNGVDYFKLSEISIQYAGFSGAKGKWAESGNCQFIDYLNVFNNIKVNVKDLKFATIENLNKTTVKKGDILFTAASETPHECALSSEVEDDIDDGIFIDDHLFAIRFNEDFRSKVIIGFAKYVFRTDHFRTEVSKVVRGVTRFYVSKKDFMKSTIPVPPIEIQNEIVRILDNFTELEAKLEAELEARTKQYEYYRNKLLDFSTGSVGVPRIDKMLAEMCPNGVSFDIISNVFDFRNGYTPSKVKPEFWKDGTIPWFRMEDIRLNGSILNDAIQKVTVLGAKNKPFPKNSIIVGTTATIGVHALITVESLANQQFTYLMLKKDFEDKINMKYFYYYMYLIDEWLKNSVTKNGFAIVNTKNFKKLEIPIPPIEVQNEIVKILDNFSEYVSSIFQGLPAEIAARRKQYEYYRNKLLTF